MGNRSGKRSSVGGPAGSGKRNQSARPFPVLTPQSYIPGSANAYPHVQPSRPNPPSPGMPPNLYPQPPPRSFQPPAANPNLGPGFQPPPSSFGMPRSNRNPMPPMPRLEEPYRPRFPSQPRYRPPVRVYRRHRSHHCRPVIHIIESDSCSSLSSCSSVSSCSRYCRRSRSCPRRRETCPPQQQPIIFLPVQCQPQSSSVTGLNQGRAQPFFLPSSQAQQPRLALSSSSAMQPSLSMPHIVSSGKPQQFQAGPIQYVQATPYSSSSQLRSIPIQSRSSIAQPSAVVESTNKQRTIIIKPIPRASSAHHLPQNDLKFKRYGSTRQESVNKNGVRIEPRRETCIE